MLVNIVLGTLVKRPGYEKNDHQTVCWIHTNGEVYIKSTLIVYLCHVNNWSDKLNVSTVLRYGLIALIVFVVVFIAIFWYRQLKRAWFNSYDAVSILLSVIIVVVNNFVSFVFTVWVCIRKCTCTLKSYSCVSFT